MFVLYLVYNDPEVMAMSTAKKAIEIIEALPPEKQGILQGGALNGDIDQYVAGHLKQAAEEEKKVQAAAALALDKAMVIVTDLVSRYSIDRVYLFGSLAQGLFDLESDIDLAVEGMPEEEYLKAYGIAENIAAPFKVDLVLLESARASLKECVLKEGRLLYDRQGEKNSPAEKATGRY